MNYYNTKYYSNTKYCVIKNIHDLFVNNNYSFKYEKIKKDDFEYQYILFYYNNINELYKIRIINDIYFVSIPLKKCNYYYTTKFDNIYKVYDYIKLHLFN